MLELIYKEEAHTIIGLCMKVHRILGSGYSEVVYKDALEVEFMKNNIPFEREKEYAVKYEDTILKHRFYADFVVMDNIILEVETVSDLHKRHQEQTINYLCVSGLRLGLLVNFRSDNLTYKRLVF